MDIGWSKDINTRGGKRRSLIPNGQLFTRWYTAGRPCNEQATFLPLYGRNFNHRNFFWLVHLEQTTTLTRAAARDCAPTDFFLDNVIYFKSVLRWEPAFAFGFSSRTCVLRYLYLPQSALHKRRTGRKPRACTPPLAHNARSKKTYHNRASNYPREERVSQLDKTQSLRVRCPPRAMVFIGFM